MRMEFNSVFWFMYFGWVLQLDSDGTIFYSTAPRWIDSSGQNWCDHWKQCVWFVKGKSLSVNKNENVHLNAIHTETTIMYEFETKSHHSNNIVSGDRLFLSPERLAIYGDNKWRCTWLNVIKSVLRSKVSPLCVVADDSVFLAIACACSCKTSNVISFFPGLRDKGYQFLQAMDTLNGFSINRVQLLKRTHQLTLLDTHQKEVDLLIGEPFYCGNDNMLPWQNLRFWKERTELDSILSRDAVIIPCKGVLKACAMSLPDLWKSRQCLEEIEGFDHTVVNPTIGACGGASEEPPCLPFFIWQCGKIKKLSETCTITEFDVSKPIRLCSGKVKVKFTETGVCHGFAVWIDYVLDAANFTVISTGPEEARC